MERASSTHDRLHVAATESEPFLELEISEDSGITLPVAQQELLGFPLADAGLPGEALGAHAVDHTEVDRLAQASLVAVHLVFVEQQPCCQRMYIVSCSVGLLQHFLS